MSKTISQTIDDLRSRLAGIENQQVELLAERDEISFAAVVDREKKAVQRLAEINTALSQLTGEASTVGAALAEASRRELQEREQEMATRRRNDAEQAETVLAEVENLALQLDREMAALKNAAVAFEGKMATVRRLSGAGPQHTALRAHLARAISSGLMGLPQHPDVLAPSERHTLESITTAWATQVRTRISAVIETAAKAA
jgi:hypothetical protein